MPSQVMEIGFLPPEWAPPTLSPVKIDVGLVAAPGATGPTGKDGQPGAAGKDASAGIAAGAGVSFASANGIVTITNADRGSEAVAAHLAAPHPHGQYVLGTDSRLSDARTPTAHNQTMSTISDMTPVGRLVGGAADAAAARGAIGAAALTDLRDLVAAIPGLLAEYRFDDNGGNRVTDHSGRGYHGTLAGSGSTWGALGLTFNGSGRVTTQVPITAVRTVVFYGRQTSLGAYNVVLSSDASGGLTWGINNNTGLYRPNPFFWVGGVGEGVRGIEDTFQQSGGQGAAWVQDGIADRVYVNGWPCVNTSAGPGGGQTAATGRTGGLVIGSNPGNGALNPFVGTLSGLMVFSTPLSEGEVATVHAYLAGLATARGLVHYSSGFSGNRIWVEGNSIDAGAVITTPPFTTAAGLYTLPHTTLSRAVGGNTFERIVGGIRSRTIQQFSSAAARNLLWLGTPTNDLYINGTSAATAFRYVDTVVRYALAAGFSVVISPVLSRQNNGTICPNFDAVKNQYNALLYAAVGGWGSRVRVIPTASLGGMVTDGAFTNTALFSDQTHPTQSASDTFIATAYAAAINSL